MSYRDKYNRRISLCIVIALLCIIIVGYVLTTLLFCYRSVDTDLRDDVADNKSTAIVYFKVNQKSLMNLPDETYLFDAIKQTTNYNRFILLYTRFHTNQVGSANMITKTILLDDRLTNYSYAVALTHEICHLKYLLGNETYTQFNAFVELYESDNQYLHDISIWFGLDILLGSYQGEYDCSDLIINYLLEKGKIGWILTT